MKVLIVHRKKLFDLEGGEKDQVSNVSAALERIGVQVRLCHTLPDDFASYDIAHFFCVAPCHIETIRKCAGMPKVLTPVFWDRAQAFPLDDIYELWPRPGRELVDKLGYWFFAKSQLRNRRVAQVCRGRFYEGLRGYTSFQQVIDEIDLFLPNTSAEATALSTFYVIENFQYKTVPNAIDPAAVDDPSDYAQRRLPRDTPFACCSGGIDRRKNQYSLVKAMLDVDVPLVFAGSIREPQYFEAVRRVAARKRGVYFLGHLNQRDLHSVYRAASVHALPSFHDTPGIANLEAVAHECANVATQIGGLREYLGEHSLYCNPFEVDHIRRQVLKALDQPPNIEGAKLVRSEYTYEKAAQATLDAYRSLLGR